MKDQEQKTTRIEVASGAIALMVAIGLLAGCPAAPPGPGPQVLCLPLSGGITTDTTLSAACYDVASDINVSGGATLTIMPGVTMKFAQNAELDIADDGRLDAQGTADDPILLTGAEAIRGYWAGVRMYHSNSTINKLNYVIIEYGGGYWDANLRLDGGGNAPTRVAITNTILRHSGTYGLSMNNDVIAEGFANNTITGNALGAVDAGPDVVGYLDEGSSYAGNDEDIVYVRSGTIATPQAWPGIDADYLVAGDLSVSTDMTLDPGAKLVFEAGQTMTVWDDGRLRAVGTAMAPITFTGKEALRGYWGGLRFYHSNSQENRLEHVIIEDGGGYYAANLYLDGGSSAPARVDIVNVTLRGSSTDGFFFNNYALVGEFQNNTVTGNVTGAGTVTGDTACFLDDASSYTGNQVDAVHLSGSSLTTSCTWAGINAEYRVGGDVSIDAALTIAPGARLIFASGQTMTVWDDGSLSAVGTADAPIEFNGVEQTPGYWGGLRFYHSNAAENRLQHVAIACGGGYYDGNLRLDGGSSSPVQVVVESCTLTQSGEHGISMNQYCNVNADIATANSFSGNTGEDVHVD